MTEKERMDRELVYDPKDESITGDQFDRMEVLYDYNMTRPHQGELRAQLIQKMFAEAGEGCYFEPPLHSNFGCSHVHIGKHVYGNYGVTFVDDGEIYVGDYVMFGPRVTVVTAAHPILPALRERALQFNRPVHIGRNVWVGAGAVILPGVTIGENSVIGAGSVVTKDIPANVVAVGVPCRVLREIGERDRKYYYKDRMFDFTVTEECEIIFGKENK